MFFRWGRTHLCWKHENVNKWWINNSNIHYLRLVWASGALGKGLRAAKKFYGHAELIQYLCLLLKESHAVVLGCPVPPYREVAMEILGHQHRGAFIVRNSTSHRDCFALSLKTDDGIKNFLIVQAEDKTLQFSVSLWTDAIGNALLICCA